MFFKHFYDSDLAQGSYMVGCQQTGEALVVDPRRDISVYLSEAQTQGLSIVMVAETHIHADFLSGARELANASGAELYLSNEGDEDWRYAFEHESLLHGTELELGNIRVRALHTPGHTPEHLSFLITDGATTDEPGFLLSGDFVFVGDVGRPDLLDEVAGAEDTRHHAAKTLFHSLKTQFLTLPDYVQVWAGHGAGSACGKSLGAVASTTVGYERRFAWWAQYLDNDDEAGFVAELLDAQPDAPQYFARMKLHNKLGPAPLEFQPLQEYAPDKIQHEVGGSFIFLDTRARDLYEKGAAKGSLHVPWGNSFATYAAYIIDPEADTRPIVVLARHEAQAAQMRDRLRRVGIDKTVGYVRNLDGVWLESVPSISPAEFKELDDPFVLDVRTQSEYDAGHIDGATQIHVGRVLWHLYDLPEDRPIIMHCQSGARSAVAASALRAMGLDVVELEGGFAGYERDSR